MNWRNTLLKEYGDRYKKDDGSEFIEGYGFIEEPYRDDRQPIMRDKDGKPLEEEEREKRMEEFRQNPKNPKITELVNWFKVALEPTMEEILNSIGPDNISYEDRGMGVKRKRDDSKLKIEIRNLGLEITQGIIDSMLEGFMDAITKDPKFNDEMTNIQRIYSSSGYNRTYAAALKMAEEMLSSIFDSVYNAIRSVNEADVPEEESEEFIDLDPMNKPPQEYTEEAWRVTSGRIEKDIKSIINNIDEYLEDVVTQDKASLDLFDLDNDGDADVEPSEIVNSIKAKLQQMASDGATTQLIKDFTGAVSFAFSFRYPVMQQSMEKNPLVADQTTEEEAEEMANRPEIKYGEEYGQARKKFEDEFKSNEQYTGEFGWQTILSKGFGTGMTSNAGFSPAIHNLAFGEKPCCDECAEVKPPCSRCKDKTTPCGCD